ncbi:MAG: hypothetical protein FJ014_13240 [Chloroflexi bacterium]|nr:hypothetical protein [Chloroflexota bacterium]
MALWWLIGWLISLYPVAWLLWKLGVGPEPVRDRQVVAELIESDVKIYWLYQHEDGFEDLSELVWAGRPVLLLPRRRDHQLYVLCSEPVVWGFGYQVVVANTRPCALEAEYYSTSGWKRLGFFDETRPRGAGTGQVDGRIRWAIPSDSAPLTLEGLRGYVVRFRPLGDLSDGTVGKLRPLTTLPRVNPSPWWRVVVASRLSACDNRPGYKKIYVWVRDERGRPLEGVKVRFGWETGRGVAYDHPNIWGLTQEEGFLEWDHFGVAAVYSLTIGEEGVPLIENIRTDLGNEYCREGLTGWIPVNRPGIYSYLFEIRQIYAGGDELVSAVQEIAGVTGGGKVRGQQER